MEKNEIIEASAEEVKHIVWNEKGDIGHTKLGYQYTIRSLCSTELDTLESPMKLNGLFCIHTPTGEILHTLGLKIESLKDLQAQVEQHYINSGKKAILEALIKQKELLDSSIAKLQE